MRWYLSTLPLWRGVGGDELMPGAVRHVGEVLGAVAGTVVGDDPLDVDDAVGGEPDPGAVHETDCSNGFFVLKRFGVSEA